MLEFISKILINRLGRDSQASGACSLLGELQASEENLSQKAKRMVTPEK